MMIIFNLHICSRTRKWSCGVQRDFASTHPAGGAHFALSGDGVRFCFLATRVEQLKVFTTVSSLYTTKGEEGLASFLRDFSTVLMVYAQRPHYSAFRFPPVDLVRGRYRFMKPLAVNSNTSVAQIMETEKQISVVIKLDNLCGRQSVQDERKIMEHLVNKKLDQFVTPFCEGLEKQLNAT